MTNDKKILAAYREAAIKEIELNQAEEELRQAQAKVDLARKSFVEAKDKLQQRQWRVNDIFEETVTPIKI